MRALALYSQFRIKRDYSYIRISCRYDVVSAWPVIGKKANQFSWQKVKLAMAVRGEDVHYRLAEIRRHHFNQTARRCALGESFEASIFAGLRESAKRLDKIPG